MNKYQFTITIDDHVYAENEYEAWAQFRNRFIDRFYGPINDQIELIEEGAEPPTPTPETS